MGFIAIVILLALLADGGKYFFGDGKGGLFKYEGSSNGIILTISRRSDFGGTASLMLFPVPKNSSRAYQN